MNVIIPLIKKVDPKLVAEDIIGVQPMTDEATSVYRMPTSLETIPKPPKEGDVRHVFSRGWEIYYGTEWIDMSTWWKIKIKGL